MSAKPNPFAISYSTHTLERIKLASQQAFSQRALMQTVDVEAYMDHVIQVQILRLSTEVLAERVLDTDQTVPWTGSVKRTVPEAPGLKHSWLPFMVAGVTGIVGGVTGSLETFIVSLVLAGLAVYLLVANPGREPYEETLPVSGRVLVRAIYWRKFPEATIRYPPELGRYVVYQELQTPYWEERND